MMLKGKKRILVTAGATTVLIDQVRAITNIFKGRTGTAIARHLALSGYEVTLITSNPGLLSQKISAKIRLIKYRTYDELFAAMKKEICEGDYDVIIHSAAVSDYKVAGVFTKDKRGRLLSVDNSRKMSSQHKELYLQLAPTEKIVDKIRGVWKFKGFLVKFKLEVGLKFDELMVIAEKSMEQSGANLIIANCLERANKSAAIIRDYSKQVHLVDREDLPKAIRKEIEL
jgi:phosphopantothenate---cysteine ligase (CTP)